MFSQFEIHRHGDQESEKGAKAFLEYMSERNGPIEFYSLSLRRSKFI